MKRMILTLLLAGIFPLSVAAQTTSLQPCALTPEQAPAIRGLRLGMSVEQLLMRFPGSRENHNVRSALERAQGAPRFGVAPLYFQRTEYPVAFQEQFAGIDSISATLFDGRVAQLEIAYASRDSQPRGPYWQSLDEFFAKLVEALSLPEARAWFRKHENATLLRCNGLEMEVMLNYGQGKIVLRGNPYHEIVRARWQADEERLRREFKP